MGNCTLTIKFVGTHHNGHPYDAEQMAARFVNELVERGHRVTHAGLTIGGETSVMPEHQKELPPLLHVLVDRTPGDPDQTPRVPSPKPTPNERGR